MSKQSKRYGSHEFMKARQQEVLRLESEISYKNKVKIYLSFDLGELKTINQELYELVKKAYPMLDDTATLDDVRITRLFDSAIRQGSIKAIELLYKLDGSMSDLTSEVDYAAIAEETEGIK